MVGYHKRADPAVAWAIGQIARWRADGEAGAASLCPHRHAGRRLDRRWQRGLSRQRRTTDEAGHRSAASAELDEQAGKEYVSFVNYYIHQVNLLRYLLGEPYRVSHVEAKGILLVAESDSGLPALLEMSPYQTAVAWEEEALVAFEHGYVRISLPPPLARFRPGRVEAYLDRRGADPRREIPTLPYVDAMAAQAARFVQVCKDEAEPLTSVARGSRRPGCRLRLHHPSVRTRPRRQPAGPSLN